MTGDFLKPCPTNFIFIQIEHLLETSDHETGYWIVLDGDADSSHAEYLEGFRQRELEYVHSKCRSHPDWACKVCIVFRGNYLQVTQHLHREWVLKACIFNFAYLFHMQTRDGWRRRVPIFQTPRRPTFHAVSILYWRRNAEELALVLRCEGISDLT